MQKKFSKRITVLFLALCSVIPSYRLYRNTNKVIQSRQQEVQIQEKNEKKVYPNLANYNNVSILVPIKQQKMIIYSGNQVIFKTAVSTGVKDNPTSTRKFAIEAERGDFFYNEESSEGVYYWVSFKDHGTYLFHSVPTDCNGNEIKEKAEELGAPCLYGCVRMSKGDAKWSYENVPEKAIVSAH